MLGKYRLKPSFLLEVAFLIAVWLIAWRVFDPPVAVLVFIIFAAYALVFLYENWLDSLSRRERADARRSLRLGSEPEHKISPPSQRTSPRAVTEKPSEDKPGAAHSVSERLSTRLHDRETQEVTAAAAPEVKAPLAPPRPALSAASTPVEDPVARVERAEVRRPEPRMEPPKRVEPAPPPVVSAPRSEPAPAQRQPEQPHSLMAEIAAGPDARKAPGSVGGWNVWQLERLLGAQAKPDPERDYERSMILVYLREFADSDGQLPPQFDQLVRDSFADLLRGPAS
ncbi:MAG: hypothetical protein ACYDHO_03935 [Gaiellaceae bacterium]